MIITIDKRRLEQAIKRNPMSVRNNANSMMLKTMNTYWRIINNTSRWRVGDNGGGVPVNTGNLRKAHNKQIAPFKSVIYVNKNKTQAGRWNYAELVHGGTRKMEGRPWLRFAEEAGQNLAKQYREQFLLSVVKDLSK